jgi:hypothetical protein
MENRTVQKEAASKRHTNRAQVQRCWPEIAQRLGQGESVSYLYDDLSERGDIAMAMRTFMRWVAQYKEAPEPPPPPVKSMDERRARHIYGRSASGEANASSNRRPRKKGEPFIGSIGIAPEPWPHSTEPPDLKKLIGEDYDDL